MEVDFAGSSENICKSDAVQTFHKHIQYYVSNLIIVIESFREENIIGLLIATSQLQIFILKETQLQFFI